MPINRHTLSGPLSMSVVSKPASKTATPGPAALPPSTVDLARGRLMQTALRALLDRVRGSREVLPHLAALESALGRQGVAAITGIAPLWLSKMYSQLSSLPVAANEPLLLDLRQRLLEAVQPRESAAPYKPLPARVSAPAPESPRSAPPREFLSTFDSDSRMMVDEISHTDFMREFDATKTTGG
jgi:hypothetical protein